VVDSRDQRAARLNLIGHLLGQIPYEDLLKETPTLPKREWGRDAPIPDLPNVVPVPARFP
jgi:hypothetical protein